MNNSLAHRADRCVILQNALPALAANNSHNSLVLLAPILLDDFTKQGQTLNQVLSCTHHNLAGIAHKRGGQRKMYGGSVIDDPKQVMPFQDIALNISEVGYAEPGNWSF